MKRPAGNDKHTPPRHGCSRGHGHIAVRIAFLYMSANITLFAGKLVAITWLSRRRRKLNLYLRKVCLYRRLYSFPPSAIDRVGAPIKQGGADLYADQINVAVAQPIAAPSRSAHSLFAEHLAEQPTHIAAAALSFGRRQRPIEHHSMADQFAVFVLPNDDRHETTHYLLVLRNCQVLQAHRLHQNSSAGLFWDWFQFGPYPSKPRPSNTSRVSFRLRWHLTQVANA
jgi:hypothetical protein